MLNDIFTFTLTIISFLSGISGLIAIIIVIWDHFKDDRQLMLQVKDFYEAIEYLIFLYYADNNLKLRGEISENYTIKENLKDMRVKIRIKHIYYERFLKYRSVAIFRYLGMSYANNNEDKIINMNSDFVLDGDGQILTKDLKGDPNNLKELKVISNPLEITRKEIEIIYTYFDSLRKFWKEKFYKCLFRPKLKQKINFFEEFKTIGLEIN